MDSSSASANERPPEGDAFKRRVARFETEAVPDALALIAARKGPAAAEAVQCAL